ncbi:hypothetical protein DFH06DRAFT_1480594 [Mycena polygramma]|nr:hypothetical protein DFH06DRAFT_1480594 [Mycena polygramma]
MHPILEVRNIQRLPPSIRRVALAACRENPSFTTLRRVEQLSDSASDSQKPYFVPVFFLSLDPTLIPTSDELESPRSDTWNRVACAATSLHAIFSLIVAIKYPEAEEVGEYLWPRVWSWLHFIDGHEEHLPSPSPISEATYVRFLIFASSISGSINSPTICSTPGLPVIIGKAWLAFPSSEETKPAAFEPLLRNLGTFIGNLNFKNPSNFAEIVEGAGGTLDDLARLVLKYIRHIIAGEGLWEWGSQGVYTRWLVFFLHDSPSKSTSHLHPLREELLDMLRHHEFIQELVAAIFLILPARDSLLAGTRLCDRAKSIMDSFELLERLLTTRMGHRWLPDALDAGLLRLLADCTTQFPEELDHTVGHFLTKLLPDGMVYYHVVAAVENALDKAAEDPCAPDFEALSEDWGEFIELAQSRITIKQDLHPYMVSIQACDNIECLKTQSRSRFGRCSGCNSFYYCSRECQTVDWKRGGHREHCASYTTLTLAESKLCPLDFHERHFLRALAESFYDENVCEINAQQAKSMAHDASHSGIVITLFDFIQNPMQITLGPLPESSVAKRLGEIGAEWSNIVARAVNSRGRLHLHVILVPQDTGQRFWVVPLRTSSSRIHDALLQLAMNLPEDCDDRYIVDEVETIRDRDELESEELVELH